MSASSMAVPQVSTLTGEAFAQEADGVMVKGDTIYRDCERQPTVAVDEWYAQELVEILGLAAQMFEEAPLVHLKVSGEAELQPFVLIEAMTLNGLVSNPDFGLLHLVNFLGASAYEALVAALAGE